MGKLMQHYIEEAGLGQPAAQPTSTASGDEPWSLTVEEMERMTGMSRRWLFHHSDKLPFVKRLSLKKMRGDRARLIKWLEDRRRG